METHAVIVTYWRGVFVADTLDEPGALGKAGFQIHEINVCNLAQKQCKACRAGVGRRFWSDRVESATRLKRFCNERALRVMAEHLAKLERSRATDADIKIPAPAGLAYLGYQKAGIAYASQRKDSLNADAPGLGKTIMSIGFVNLVKPESVIVVCPKTLIFNWRNEAMKWLTEDYEVFPASSRKDVVPPGKVFAIVNYEKIIGDSPLARSLKRQWGAAVFDECHYIKDENAKRSIAAFDLARQSKRNLFLTGTPIESFPKEIWPVAAFCSPPRFGDKIAFLKRYCGLHSEPRSFKTRKGEEFSKNVWVDTGATNLAELQQRLRSSIMCRRLKQDVLKELPPKRRQLIMLEDSKVDWSKHPQFKRWRELYEAEHEQKLAQLESAKTEAEYKDAAHALEKFTGVAFTEMSQFRHETALAKLPLCLDYLDEVLEAVPNLVIFAHHVDVIEKIVDHFKADAVSVTGSTPDKGPNSREAAVRQFQEGKKRIFVGQIRAAGVGITLTAASTVVFVEIDWVPGVLTQCEDRLCRIGQKKMVHVIHLCLSNTLDANMTKKIVEKQEVIDRALDKLPEVALKKGR